VCLSHIVTYCHILSHIVFGKISLQKNLVGHSCRSFPQKSAIISGSFAKNDLQLRHPMSLRHPVIRNQGRKYLVATKLVPELNQLRYMLKFNLREGGKEKMFVC